MAHRGTGSWARISGFARLLALALWVLVGCGGADGGGSTGGRGGRGGDAVGSTRLYASVRPTLVPPPPLAPQGLEAATGHGRVGMDGAFHYTIPIEVPPGRAGMTPEVSLTYSSSAGNGPLGMGWQLDATSIIARCAVIPAAGTDRDTIRLRSDAEYCLDGQHLVLMTGNRGQVGAEYRTEIDSFARIRVTESGADGPLKWTVERKNGRIAVYGTLPDSIDPAGPWTQQRLRDTNGAVIGTLNVQLFWPMVEERDRVGNTVLYEYARSNRLNDASAAPLLSRITYTRCASCGFANNRDRTVTFAYEERPATDRIEQYARGVAIKTTRRLFQILVQSWAGTIPTELRRYTLEYHPDLTGRLTKRSLLRRINACDSVGRCTPWTKFAWQATVAAGYRQYAGGYNDFAYEANLDNTHLMEIAVFDANGDGNDDVLLYEPSAAAKNQSLSDPENPIAPVPGVSYVPKLMLGDGGGHFASTATVTLPSSCVIYQLSRAIPVDLDGNGTTELVVECAQPGQGPTQPVVATHRVLSWQGSPGALVEVTVPGLSGKTVEQQETTVGIACVYLGSGILRFGDLNGDGLPEMLWATRNGTWMVQQASKAAQPAPAPQVSYGAAVDSKVRAIGPATCQAAMSVTAMLDENGDGHTELAQFDMSQGVRSYTWGPFTGQKHVYTFRDGERNESWSDDEESPREPTLWRTANFAFPISPPHPWYFVDINGDGLNDALYLTLPDTWQTRINTGSGYTAPVTLTGAVATALTLNHYNPQATWTLRKDHGIQFADMNGDGKQDIVLMASSNNDQPWQGMNLRWRRSLDPVRIMYSNGSGFDAPVAMSVANNLLWAQRPRPGAPQFAMSALADVNGDGLGDVIGMTAGTGTTPKRRLMTWSYGDQLPGGVDRMKTVEIDGILDGNGIVEEVVYDQLSSGSIARNAGLATWDTHQPVRGGSFPAASVARGTVVKKYFSKGRNAGKPTAQHWKYRGALADRTGRGFLGFAEAKVMDVYTGVFTRHDFRQTPVTTGGPFNSSYRHYPFTMRPSVTQVWDAPDASMQPPVDGANGLVAASGTVGTSRFYTDAEYAGHPLRLRSENASYSAFSATNGRPPYSADADTPHFSTDTEYDDWGNPRVVETVYGDYGTSERKQYSRTITTTYTIDQTAWLISQPKLSTEVTSTKNPYLRDLDDGDLGIWTDTRVTEFWHNATTGLLEWITREPNKVADNTSTPAFEPAGGGLQLTRFYYTTAGALEKTETYSPARATCAAGQTCTCTSDAACGTNGICTNATSGAVNQCFDTRSDSIIYDPESGSVAEGFKNALGQTRWELYDPTRLWHYLTVDYNDLKTVTTRDTFGRPRRIDFGTGAWKTFSYENADYTRIVRTTQSGGPDGTQFFDRYGNPEIEVWSTFSGGSGVTRTLFNVLGKPRETSYKASTATLAVTAARRSDALAAVANGTITLSAQYDTAGRVTSLSNGPGIAGTTYAYASPLGTTTETDALGQRTTTLSDMTDRISKRTQYTLTGTTKVTSYRYKGTGQLAMIDNDGGIADRFYYDPVGRPTAWSIGQLDEIMRWNANGGYNGFDQVLTDTRDGVTVTYTYDKLDRLRTRTAAGDTQSFDWDDPAGGIGKLRRAHNSADGGHEITFTGFTRGKPGERRERFLNGTANLSFGYTYDGFGRLDTLRYPEAGTSDSTAVPHRAKAGPTVRYTYQNGQIAAITDTATSTKLYEVTARHVLGMATTAKYGAALTTSWTHDPRTLAPDLQNTSGVTPAPSQDHNFALTDRLSSRTTGGIVETYGYDGSTQFLETYSRSQGQTKRIEANFDVANRGLSAVTTTLWNQSTDWPDADETFTFKAPFHSYQIDTHTVNGVTQTYTYDAAGRVTDVRQGTTLKRHFDWNGLNLPTRAQVFGPPDLTRTFAYDAYGSRVRKTQDTNNEVLYLGKLYEARNLASGQESVYRLYADVGVVAEIVHPWNSNTRITRYLFTDHQGSPAFQVVENGTTRVSTQLGFFPFGRRQNDPPTQRFSQLGYTGHIQDDDLGLIDMEGRIFDLTTRRFLTRDKLADRPLMNGGANPYAYATNDPTNYVDPSGFQAIPGDGIDDAEDDQGPLPEVVVETEPACLCSEDEPDEPNQSENPEMSIDPGQLAMERDLAQEELDNLGFTPITMGVVMLLGGASLRFGMCLAAYSSDVMLTEEFLIASGYAPATAAGFARSFSMFGRVTPRVTNVGERLLRYSNGSRVGNFLGKAAFKNSLQSRSALNIAKYGNMGGVRQGVYATQPSLVLEGKIAGGSGTQTLVIDPAAFEYGLGVILPY